MAGLPKSVNTDIPIDSHFLSYINNLSSGGNTTNVTSSKDTIKQYVKTKNGIFNGAFGSVGHALTISSGELDLTANATGAVVVRRMIQVNPESSTSDTIDKIESNGLELPYQELTLIATTNNTITLAHASSVSGTQKNIYCPGDTSYVLAPNEAVKLIYDPVNTIWIVTGSNSSSATVADNSITFAKIQDIATMKVIGRTASGSGDSSEISILDEDTMSSNSATALATQQSIKAYVLANSGSTSFSGFTADATLDMGNFNIEDVNVLKINSGSANSADAFTMFGTSSAGAINLVDDNDFFDFQVDGDSKFRMYDDRIEINEPLRTLIANSPDIGQSTYPFGTVHAQGFNTLGTLTVGTNSLQLGNISTNGIIGGYSGVIGIQCTDDTITKGTQGTVQIPELYNNSEPSASDLNGWFGNADGCIGIMRTASQTRLYARSNSTWKYEILS